MCKTSPTKWERSRRESAEGEGAATRADRPHQPLRSLPLHGGDFALPAASKAAVPSDLYQRCRRADAEYGDRRYGRRQAPMSLPRGGRQRAGRRVCHGAGFWARDAAPTIPDFGDLPYGPPKCQW